VNDIEICVRECLASDLLAVHEIEKACFGVTNALPLIALTQYRDLCGPGFVIGEASSKVAGYAAGGIALGAGMDLAWILGVAVSPDFQGHRVGAMLCGNVLAALRRVGVQRVRATVAPDNARSLKMFGQLGFSVIEDSPDYFGPGQRRLVMERRLNSPSRA
jgi:ribosomal protein S18 acetylase RimI-like enzyme